MTLRQLRFFSLMPVTLILLLVAILGAAGLNADTIWYDEWWSIYNAGGVPGAEFTPLEAFTRVAEKDPFHVPGFFVLLGVWGSAVGWSEVAARALAWLGGMLAVAMVYRAGSDLISRKAGLYAALALGTSAFFLSYFHEVRMYSLVPFLSALSMWLYWRALRAKPTPLLLVALFLTLAGLLYTHYVAGLLALSIGLYHVIFAPKNRDWLVILLVIGAAGLLFVPWLGIASNVAVMVGADQTRQAVSKNAFTALTDLLYLFSNGSIALLLIFAAFALPRTRALRFVWLIGGCTLLLALLANERFHFISNIRYLIAMFPPLALIVGAGAAQIERSITQIRYAPLLLGAWVAAGIWLTLNPAYFDGAWVTVLPWDKLADEVRDSAQPGELLVFLMPDGTPNWLHDPVARYYLHGIPVDLHLIESLPEKTPEQYYVDFTNFVGSAPLFQVAFDPAHRHAVFAESALQRFVGGRYIACQPTTLLPDLTVQSYATAVDIPFNYQFGAGIALGLIQPLPSTIQSSLHIPLRVIVDPALPRGEYSVALHIEDAAGTLVRQTDFGLPDGCAIASIPDLPPGSYRALLTVYRWQTGERLPATNAATGEQGDRLPLGEFTVTG